MQKVSKMRVFKEVLPTTSLLMCLPSRQSSADDRNQDAEMTLAIIFYLFSELCNSVDSASSSVGPSCRGTGHHEEKRIGHF